MALRSLRKEIITAICAGEQAIRVNTDEHEDAIKTIGEVCRKYKWRLQVWDQIAGTVEYIGDDVKEESTRPKGGGPAGLSTGETADLSHLGGVLAMLRKPAEPDPKTDGLLRPCVLVMKNFHIGFDSGRGPLCAAVQHLVGDKIADQKDYKEQHKARLYDPRDISGEINTGKFLVGLMPSEARLPPEVAPLFKVLDHELPDVEELGNILDGVLAAVAEEYRVEDLERAKLCRHALGMTRFQAEGAFAASMIERKKMDAEFIWQEKARILNKEGLVEVYVGKETFEDVVGLNGVKTVLTKLLTPDEYEPDNPDVRGKGILLVGGPGVGKSMVAKAAGNSLNLPLLQCNPGNLMDGLVGSTERNTRKLFQVLKVMSPCLALIDEVEKTMPSAKGGSLDSGVGRRMAGTFMTQMNDMTEPVFWLFTANDVADVHEAFFRAERVDACFFVPLPTAEQRAAAWKHYLKKFFPAEINGKPFPRYVELDIDLAANVMTGSAEEKSQASEKLAACLMAVTPAERAEAQKELSGETNLVLRDLIFDDTGWTPAEIRACCRLSRRLQEPLAETARRIRPISVSAKDSLTVLEKWAENAALDAETGELYGKPAPAPMSRAAGGGKVRRRVSAIRD